jgi:predicted transposase/invertase (TIGR01784 family)
MKTDNLFYRLFQTLPVLFFDLAGRPELAAVDYQFRSEEVKQTAFRLDGIFFPPAHRSELPIFFIEVQFQPDPQIYTRLFAEVFLYLK